MPQINWPTDDYFLRINDAAALYVYQIEMPGDPVAVYKLDHAQPLQLSISSTGAEEYVIQLPEDANTDADGRKWHVLRYEIERQDGLEFDGKTLLGWKLDWQRNPKKEPVDAEIRYFLQHNSAALTLGLQLVEVAGEWFLDVFCGADLRSAPPWTPWANMRFVARAGPAPAQAPGPGDFRVIRDDGKGRLRTLMMVPNALFTRGDSGIKPAYRSFLARQSAENRVFLGCPGIPADRPATLRHVLDGWGIDPRGYEILVSSQDRWFSPWIRDLLTICTNTEASAGRFAVPEGKKAGFAGEILSQQRSLQLTERPAGFAFDGGDVIAGEDGLLFVGKNVVANLARHLGNDQSARTLIRQQMHAKQLIEVGTAARIPEVGPPRPTASTVYLSIPYNYQPGLHIDMFMAYPGTCGGKHPPTILLGDPQWAYELADHPDVYRPTWPLAAAFEEIAGLLREAGLRVLRNPLPILYTERADYYYACYNNVVMDFGTDPVVYLPTFADEVSNSLGFRAALERLDAENSAIWESLLGAGCVRPMERMLPPSQTRGGIRCMTNVFARQR